MWIKCIKKFTSRHHQCSVFREALLNSAYLFSSFPLLTQSWSSPLQETSSMPWRRPALTSCWEGKAGTLLWAHSQSTQRRAPLFLESRPRGGDWSGLCFDSRFFSLIFVPQRQTLLIAPTRTRGRALTNSECGLLCAKTKLNMRLFVSCSRNACSTKKHQDQVLLLLFLSATPERVLSNISNLQPPCCVHQSRLLQFPQTVCISHSHLKRRATEAFNWLLLWCWLSSPSQVALDAFFSFFHPNSMIRISFNLPIAK